MTTTQLSDFMLARYGVSLPDYTFYPYSKASEYKVKQGVFTYFIDKQFVDNLFPQNVFRASRYLVLADWLEDNRLATRLADDFFGITDMYDSKKQRNLPHLRRGYRRLYSPVFGVCVLARVHASRAFEKEYVVRAERSVAGQICRRS